MKVIFTDSVPGVAGRGDIKNVRNGYFRNFLLPRSKAVPATTPLLRDWEERRKRIMIQKEELKTKIEEMKRRLEGAKVRLEKKVTSKGTLYGGVKSADVAKAVKDQFSIEIPVEAVEIREPVKALGSYVVHLNLGEGVGTDLPIEIIEKK